MSNVNTPFTCRGVPWQRRWALAVALTMALSNLPAPILIDPGTVSAQAPVGAGFTINAGDLRFIFRQIQIAQAHAAGGQLFGPGPNQVNEPRLPFGLRTVDGSFNHLVSGQTRWGAADEIFPRRTTPVFRPAEQTTSYTQKRGIVRDSQPRIISNAIADQTVNNPAAVAASGYTGPTGAVQPEPLGTLPIPDVAPDVGLSAPFNSMFTFFGQFFDHGLDLVTKGGGSVVVPLQPGDPLFNAGPDGIPNNGDDPPTNFMVLTRATNRDCTPGPGCVPDGIGDNPTTAADESANDVQEATNTTTAFVDQNQTYTSHPSHQVFLREYTLVNNRPVATGRLIDGAIAGNIGNWGEVKAQARTMLGIQLRDLDVFNVPLLDVDPYGRFRRGPNGFPRIMTGTGAVEGNPAANGGLGVLVPANALRTGHAFLDDIAHNANPVSSAGVPLGFDADLVPNPIDVPRPAGTYDNELLDAHFVTGDGRGNENIALTAVHAVFHLEHNRLAQQIEGMLPVNAGSVDNTLGFTQAELNAWRAVDTPSGWDFGERVFQAARFITEMQYQHLVFEEFARKLVPSINAFIGDGINFRSDTNPSIVAEFAHAVYRLGHSMLTETIARTRPNGTTYDIPLLEGFLNPLEFNDNDLGGTLTAAQAAGAIFQGGTRQVGNMIDEFVTEAVRNRLLGLPLDLAVLNLARARSEGIPPLNEVRRQLFAATHDSALAPYGSWFDFGFELKHPETLSNFVAAYGIHASLQGAATIDAKRAAAELLLGDTAFMFGDPAATGLNNVDLWIGGLAERIAPFGSMLGTTFNHIFEIQLEHLQDGDRFYYLERLDGLNLLSQLEGNSFAELVQRNTALTGAGADIFARPDLVIDIGSLVPDPANALRFLNDPTEDPAEPGDDRELVRLPDGTIRYTGPAHVIWVGRNGLPIDSVISSEGDDTLRGNGENDRLEGGAGNDQHIGGAGDDILTDTFGDDVIKGGPGNDAISGGAGPFDLLQGNDGNDFVVGGPDDSEVFGGNGNDIIYMGAGLSESVGGAGDDWLEGTLAPASIAIGDDNNQFQNDPNGGHDVGVAGPADMDFDMEGGDDIMVGTVLPTHRFEGMLGFDWATYRGETTAVDADMLITGLAAVQPPLNEVRDRFDLTEGLSGTDFGDLLRGDDRDVTLLTNDGLTNVNNGHVLTSAGIARINGLTAILPAGTTTWAEGNIILGGAGPDIIEGRGGNDIIDGRRWLNVQLAATVGGTPRRANSLHELRPFVFSNPQQLNPGSITIVREILLGADAVDTAVFSGPRAEYDFAPAGAVDANNNVTSAGPVTVIHARGNQADGTDTLFNIDRLVFLGDPVPVPNVTGFTQNQAFAALQAVNLALGAITFEFSTTIAIDRVIRTNPVAGTLVTPGTAVALVVSLGPPPNTAPVANNDTRTTPTNVTLNAATVLGNDTDAENNPLTAVLNAAPAANPLAPTAATFAFNANGTFTYNHGVGITAANNPTPVTFTYRASDGLAVSNLATVTINVTRPAGQAVANNDTATTLANTPVTTNVDANDNNGNGGGAGNDLNQASLTIRRQAVNGTATVVGGANRQVTYTPNPGFTGTDTYTYTIADNAGLTSNPAVVTVTVAAATIPANLVAAFNFNEATGNALNSAGTGVGSGTLSGAVRVPGQAGFGSAMSFDGVNDFVQVPDNAALDITGQLTLTAWVNPSRLGPTGTESGWRPVILKERPGGLVYALQANEGPQITPGGYARIGFDRRVGGIGPGLPLNTWTHVALTRNGATMVLYVNGVARATITNATTGLIETSGGVLRIGGTSQFAPVQEFFAGLIDNVRIYNRALSAAEINQDRVVPQ